MVASHSTTKMNKNKFKLEKFDKDSLLEEFKQSENLDSIHDPNLSLRLQKICLLFNCWLNTRKNYETDRLTLEINDGLKEIELEHDRQETEQKKLVAFMNQIEDALKVL